MAMAVAIIPASAATPKTIYLKPSSNWLEAGAWFQAWTWGGTSGDAWVTFTDSNYDGIYEATIPSDRTGMKILRKGPSQAANSWTSWAETGDISIPTNKNCLSNSGWGTSFTWSTIATPSAGFTLTVAGQAGLAGTEWDATNASNDMTLVSGRVYEKTFTGVKAGTYEFKVLANHGWTFSWGSGSGNASVTVEKDNSNVTITFNEETKAITATDTHVHIGGTATCTKKAECTVCGEEHGEVLGHSATCGHSVANVGDVYYESIKDAIENAESGTITLVDDVTYEGTLAITNENIVIDLNGHNLVADGIVTFGYGVQIVDSGETKGLIDVERDKLVFAPLKDEETGKETPATSTEIVPVWNGEGYVIADVTDRYEPVASDAENKFIIDFKPKFNGVAHSYVKGGETVTGLTFEVRITGGDFDKTYTVEDSIIAEAYNGKSVRLNLINAKEGVTYTVQLIIKSECGLHYVGELGQYTYTVPADAE